MSSDVPKKRRLDLAAIVDAASALADRDGLDGVSMRKLAGTLEVTPMALYNHIPNREALIDAMVEQLVAGISQNEIETPASAEPHVTWKHALRTRILSARAAMQRHPWAQSAIETREHAGPAVLTYMDDLMAIMFAGELSADLVHHAMHALSSRMWGFTRDVLPTPAMPDDPLVHAEALAGYARQYPAIIHMATSAPHAGAACNSDAEFIFALDILLDAFERLRASGWASSPSS